MYSEIQLTYTHSYRQVLRCRYIFLKNYFMHTHIHTCVEVVRGQTISPLSSCSSSFCGSSNVHWQGRRSDALLRMLSQCFFSKIKSYNTL